MSTKRPAKFDSLADALSALDAAEDRFESVERECAALAKVIFKAHAERTMSAIDAIVRNDVVVSLAPP